MLLAAGLVCACSKKADGPPDIIKVQAAEALPARKPVVARKPANAEEALEAELMLAVFGENYLPDTGDAVADLPNVRDRTSTGSYRVSPSGARIDPDGVAILIANAFDANDTREPFELQMVEGLLNIFLLEKKGDKWTVLKRRENVLLRGAHGYIGDVQWIQLAAGKTGFALINGYVYQGSTVDNMAIFDPRAAELQNLTDDLNTHTDNSGECAPTTERCWDIRATWHMEPAQKPALYDDIVFDFSGDDRVLVAMPDEENASDKSGEAAVKKDDALPKDGMAADKNGAVSVKQDAAADAKVAAADAKADDEPKRVEHKISGQARYAYDGKQYRLVSGAHLVPEL